MDESPSAKLFRLTRFEYPESEGVTAVPTHGRIGGSTFFPGGDGLYREDEPEPPFPFGKIMVIGNDFDTLENFEEAPRDGEIQAGTWVNLRHLLTEARVDPADAFYTNCYLGLRLDAKTNRGPAPGSRNEAYRGNCLRVMAEQIGYVKPRVILCLKQPAKRLIADLACKLAREQRTAVEPGTSAATPPDVMAGSDSLDDWRRDLTFKEIDSGNPVRRNVQFGGLQVDAIVALTHPCLPNADRCRGSFGNEKGAKAEVEMVREATRGLYGARP